MKMQLQALCLATLGGAASLLVPGTAQAGNVGYYMACGSANPSSAITLAGHTPVSVTTLDSASLAPLDGLVIANCSGTYSGTPALNTAVANGLRVLMDSKSLPSPSLLPGSPALAWDTTGQCGDVSIPPGSPVANGPGGTLTETNLDTSFLCSPMGSVDVSTLPSGGVSLVGLAGNPTHAVASAYPAGGGLVALSISQWMYTLPGGGWGGAI